MKCRIAYCWLALIIFLLSSQKAFSSEYFQQRVKYNIQVNFDHGSNKLQCTEWLTYYNNSKETLSFIWFHLWANAYSSDRSAFAKQSLKNNHTKFYYSSPDDRGGYTSVSFKQDNKLLIYEFDEKNIDICKVYLAKPLLPGDSCVIEIPFTLLLPNARFSRMGYDGVRYQLTQWYPKPAVFDKNGWHTMPYLNYGEFYSEFGCYDVYITLPQNYVVAATGILQNPDSEQEFIQSRLRATKSGNYLALRKIIPDDKNLKTLHFHQDSVHDFAWFASKYFFLVKGKVQLPHSARIVETEVYFTSDNPKSWMQCIDYLNEAIWTHSLLIGDYPYSKAVVVAGGEGGMEYPMITLVQENASEYSLYETIFHEVGHFWFYGILASNERDHPWLDEGINTFYQFRNNQNKYQGYSLQQTTEMSFKINGLGLNQLPSSANYYLPYLYEISRGNNFPASWKSTDYSVISYFIMTYYKPALLFNYLYYSLGAERFDEGMKLYYETWKFKHPSPEDFFTTFCQGAGLTSTDVLKKGLYDSRPIDFALKRSKSVNDSVKFYVKSPAKYALPFSVAGIFPDGKCDSLYRFTSDVTGKTWITMPRNYYKAFLIDPNSEIPESNRNNNLLRNRWLLPGRDTLHLRMLYHLPMPGNQYLFFLPVMGTNLPGGWMPGMVLFNDPIFNRHWQYRIMPLYSFELKKPTGYAEASYSFYPNMVFSQIVIKSSFRQFGLDDYSHEMYQKVKPVILAKINTSPSNPMQVYIFYQYHYLRRQMRFYDQWIFTPVDYTIKNVDFAFHEMGVSFDNKMRVSPMSSYIKYEMRKSFGKLSAEWKCRFTYNSPRKGLDIRLFGGKFMYWNQSYWDFEPNVQFRLNSMGPWQDYRYEEVFIGRSLSTFPSSNSNFWSQQMVESDGGFKLYTPYGMTNNWLLAINLRSSLPGRLPVRLYASAARSANWDILFYETGAQLCIADGVFEVNFPLFRTNEFRENEDLNQLKYVDKIRFTLRLDKLNPFNFAKSFPEMIFLD